MLHPVFVLLHIFTKLMENVLVYLSLKRSEPGIFFFYFFIIHRLISARSNVSGPSGIGMGDGDMGWIDLAQDREMWRTLVNAVTNFQVP
jgi:hypothetical protein